MSHYYRHKFISPVQIYAKVKEELKSYFDTGIVDDLLFPKYTEYCLKKLGRVTYKVAEIPLVIKNFQATLPEDFFAVRELWGCLEVGQSISTASAIYTQKTIRVTPHQGSCEEFDECIDKNYTVTMKTTGEILLQYKLAALLRPGNHNALMNCSSDCANIFTQGLDTFDIRDNKILTSFSDGVLHLIYYKIELDEDEYQLIPDLVEFTDYLESYLKYKIFENIYNSTTDESFNQVERKYLMYKQEAAEKYISALTAFRRQSIYQVAEGIKKQNNRFSMYEKMMGRYK